jgi:hypothetical protein
VRYPFRILDGHNSPEFSFSSSGRRDRSLYNISNRHHTLSSTFLSVSVAEIRRNLQCVLKSSSFSWEVSTIRISMIHKIVTSPKPSSPLTYLNLLTAGLLTTSSLNYVYPATDTHVISLAPSCHVTNSAFYKRRVAQFDGHNIIVVCRKWFADLFRRK